MLYKVLFYGVYSKNLKSMILDGCMVHIPLWGHGGNKPVLYMALISWLI